MKPSFIGIGVQKCATTWLYRILRDHPDIGMASRKEMDYFSHYYSYGYRWYERHFDKCGNTDIVGEVSPSYFCEYSVPERVHQYNPDIKILVSFRDPLKRAISNHHHEVCIGHLADEDLDFESGMANNPMYIEQGKYATHLARWYRYFPQEQVHVVLVDDIENDPAAVAVAVYDFLGISRKGIPDSVLGRFNQSHVKRSRLLASAKDAFYRSTQHQGGKWLYKLGCTLGLRRLYRSINKVESRVMIPDPDAATLEYMRDIFTPEVQQLSAMIGRPLDSWLQHHPT